MSFYGYPTLEILVDGRLETFCCHRLCGPIHIISGGHIRNDVRIMHSIGLWNAQGSRVVGGICQWEEQPEIIVDEMPTLRQIQPAE